MSTTRATSETRLAEFQRIEEALHARLELEALITRISTSFINLPADQIDDGIHRALGLIGAFVGADRGFIAQYTDDGLRLNGTHEWCAEGIASQRGRMQQVSIESFPWYNLHIMRRESVFYVPGVLDLPAEATAERAEFAVEGIQSLVAVPMESRGVVVGFIGYASHTAPRIWPDDAVDLLRMMSSIFANVLEHQRSQAIQDGQNRFLELLATEGSLAETLRALVGIIQEQSPGMQGLVLLLDGNRLSVGASVSLPTEYVNSIEGLEIGPMVGSCGTAAYLKQAVIVEDIARDPRWDGLRSLALAADLRACWSEPVFSSAGDVLGTFAMYYVYPRSPTDAERRTIKTAAHLAGVAIEHKRAQEALQRANLDLERRVEERTRELEHRRRVAESLRGTIAVINSNRALNDILDFIVAQAKDLLNADACALHSLDAERETVTLEASCGWPDDLAALPLSVTDPARDTLLMRQIRFSNHTPADAETLLHDLTLDPQARQRKALIRRRYAASLSVPLAIKDDLFGSLVFYYEQPQQFPDEQVEVAATFAEQAALAIENTRLRERLERSAAEAERGRLARDLHDSVTQTLFSASLIAEVLPRVWHDSPEEGRGLAEEVRLLTRGALAEMRTLLLELRPAALLQAELAESLRHLADATTARAGIPVKLVVQGREPMPAELKVALYRIAQEALNNVVKHAEADHAVVTLDSQAGRGELTIQDDGRGFERSRVSSDHLGLGIMAERAQATGAQLTIDSQPGQGTRISVRWLEKDT